MPVKRGRPTTEKKENWTGFRLSTKDIEKLEFCSKKTGLSRAEIVRRGIDMVYKKLISK